MVMWKEFLLLMQRCVDRWECLELMLRGPLSLSLFSLLWLLVIVFEKVECGNVGVVLDIAWRNLLCFLHIL